VTGLTRTTPMKRRYRKRADRKPMCVWAKCRRARYEGDLCAKHAADKLFSRMVRERDGRCMAGEQFPEVGCLGDLQCMHLIPRSYMAVRWDLDNARAGCAAHHLWLTNHPIEHIEFCEQQLGDYYATLRWVALHDPAEKPEAALARLRQMEAA